MSEVKTKQYSSQVFEVPNIQSDNDAKILAAQITSVFPTILNKAYQENITLRSFKINMCLEDGNIQFQILGSELAHFPNDLTQVPNSEENAATGIKSANTVNS